MRTVQYGSSSGPLPAVDAGIAPGEPASTPPSRIFIPPPPSLCSAAIEEWYSGGFISAATYAGLKANCDLKATGAPALCGSRGATSPALSAHTCPPPLRSRHRPC